MLHSISMIHPSELTFDVIVRWRAALANQKSWSSPFLTPEFAQAVGQQRQDARIIIARDTQGLIGILGIHKRPGGYARLLGAPISDHQAFISETGFTASMEDVLKAAKVSTLSFNNINDPQVDFGHVIKDTHFSHLADLSTGAEQYFDLQRQTYGRHFKKMRQRARGAIRDHGTMEMKLDSQNKKDFELLLQWKCAQFHRTRKCDVLAARWIKGLLQSLWETQGRVRAVLNVLYLGGQPAAAEIGLLCNGIYHSWIAAYDPELSRCSPGLLLLEGIIQNAGELGITLIDLGSGHDHYKKYYANDRLELGQGKFIGEGFVASQHHLLEQYGTKVLAGTPARIANSMGFMAACHPSWQGKLRGVAGRLSQLIT